ncbi:MAG TPA: peptidoglycan-binding domain-containing protein [Stellaceae bacterium]|nr:peptidoglycan-binding domain-containing protein [Stellaceae bacterium]
MRKLTLAAVSAIALGIAGAGPLYAQTANTSPGVNPAPATTTTNPTAAAPASPTGVAQPAMPQAETSTPGTMGSMNNMGTSEHFGRLSRADIKQIQSELQREGLYHGRIDGIDGRGTHQALRAYQQHNGMRATGRLDHQTLASLLGTGTGMGSSMPPSNMNGTNNDMNTPSSGTAGTAGSNNTTNGTNQ